MDITKCEFRVKGSQYINGEYLCMASTNSRTTCPNKFCKDNPNCYYKQLHSQEKTFTLDEVKNIQTQTLITLNTEENVRKCKWLFSVFNNLLSEFEKEVK